MKGWKAKKRVHSGTVSLRFRPIPGGNSRDSCAPPSQSAAVAHLLHPAFLLRACLPVSRDW